MRRLRPPRERRDAFGREPIDPALDAEEPAVDVVQQDLRPVRYGRPDLGGAARTAGERCRAGKRLLTIGGHDRDLGGAARDRVAEPPAMLPDEPRTALGITARAPGARLDQELDKSCRRHAEQSKAQEP